MKELLPKKAIQKAHLPLYLGTWIDKTSAQRMYTPLRIRAWSLPHLKGGGWYLDCSKGFCPTKEEADKAAIHAIHASAPGPMDSQEDLEELIILEDKERENLLAKKKKEANRALLKKQKDEEKEKEKKKKAEEKAKNAQGKTAKKTSMVAGKSINTPEVISSASPSSQSCKRDADLAGLSLSTLQYGTSPLAGVSTGASTIVDEFFFQGSLLTLAAHLNKHSNFPKEWSDLQALLEQVSSFNNLFY
jgi:hypothetical protein